MTNHPTARDGVPQNYPGRLAYFPPEMQRLVVGVLGLQQRKLESLAQARSELAALLALGAGPAHCEWNTCTGPDGLHEVVVTAYWRAPQDYAAWIQQPQVDQWWQAGLAPNAVGRWREVAQIPAKRFQFAAGTEDRHGASAVLPLKPCNTFGFWGAYRARLSAAATDTFESAFTQVPQRQLQETFGRALAVQAPDNLCMIREGQGFQNCSDDEMRVWREQMEAPIAGWVAFLAHDPSATGCLSIRDCFERELATWSTIPKRSQVAFLLSLGHIEKAARTEPTHLAVHNAFVQMYQDLHFTPRMHVWVELSIIKAHELAAEYFNCHPATGLLPYFPLVDLAESR